MIDLHTPTHSDQQRADESESGSVGRLLDGLREWREQRMQDRSEVLVPVVLVIGSLCLALVVGALAAILVVGPQALVNHASSRPSGEVTTNDTQVAAINAPGPTLLPAQVADLGMDAAEAASGVTTPLTMPLATAPPTAAPTHLPTVASTIEPTAIPSADDVWPATLHTLDPIWNKDLPRAVAVLDDFLARFPDHEPARDKQYAALVAYGQSLEAQGDLDNARNQFLRARDLSPERVEAPNLLNALDAVAAADAAPQSAAGEVDAPLPAAISTPTATSRAAAPQNQAPPPPPSTPTKVPFRPPAG